MLAAFAGTLRASGICAGQTVLVNEPVDKNLHLAGGDITINAPVGGDLICAGGNIRINETIKQDIIAAGGEVWLDKAAGQDVRIGGGRVLISADVAGDLVVTGGTVTVNPGVTIGGDVIIAGGKVNLLGATMGDVRIAAGELLLAGPIQGELIAQGGKIEINSRVAGTSRMAAERIQLGAGAQFAGNVRYWQKSGEMDFGAALQNGAEAVYDPSLKMQYAEWETKARMFGRRISPLAMLYRLASGALLVGLIVAFFGWFFERFAAGISRNAGKFLGVGLLYLIGVPIVIAITAITIVGIPAALAIGGIYGATVSVAGALTAVVAAYALEQRLNRNWSRGQMIMVALGIYLALKLVSVLPVIGSLGVFALTAIAFGFIIQAMRGKVPLQPAAAAASAPEDIV